MARSRTITTMAELSAALMAAFNAINRDFYDGKLEKVIITVKEGKKKNAFGWIETQKHWSQNGKPRHEINISSDYIGERTVEQTIVTLMHEMVHLYNLQNSIKDTSRAGVYHNKKFKETAESHGLICTEGDQVGFSHTTATDATKAWIKENVKIRSFGVYKCVADKAPGEPKTKQSMRKMVCPDCGGIARVTSDFPLICKACNKELILES